MQLFIKTCIFALGFLLYSTVVDAEKADEQNQSFPKTLEDYNQAIRLDQNNAQAYYKRGVTHENFGHPRLAMIDFEQAINLDLNYAAAYSSRGNGYLNSGNFELACNDFRKACELGDCAYLKWAKKNGNCRQ